MKSFLSVFGAFMFSVFSEGFIRIIIIFYHNTEFQMFGLNALPSPSWGWIILGASTLIYWLSGMLILTINQVSPIKHLVSFGAILVLWKSIGLYQTTGNEPLWFYLASFVLIPLSLYLCFLTQQKTIEKTTT